MNALAFDYEAPFPPQKGKFYNECSIDKGLLSHTVLSHNHSYVNIQDKTVCALRSGGRFKVNSNLNYKESKDEQVIPILLFSRTMA